MKSMVCSMGLNPDDSGDYYLCSQMTYASGNVRTHRWSRVTLCPWECFGIPTRRKRSYWLGQII